MANIVPLTEEEFMKIASDEGVPLSLASSLYGIESAAGRDPSAFVDPRLKEGKGNFAGVPANKIGWGSLQMTGQNAAEFMPGIDFYSATDEQLTRGAMKLIKKNMNADGSYDINKIARAFFGAGVDKAMAAARNEPGYSPSNNPGIMDKLRRGIWNMDNQWIDGQSIADTLKLNLPNDVDLSKVGANVNTQANQLAVNAEKTLSYDPVAAQAKFEEAKNLKAAALQAVLDKQIERNNIALDAAKMNPYGAYSEALKTLDALQGANERLRQTVADRNFETPSANDGLLGVLEYFGRKMAADADIDSRIKEVNSLQTAANNYQIILNNLQKNAATGGQTLNDAISIDTAARAAGAEVDKFSQQATKVDQYNTNVALRNAAQVSTDQNRAHQQQMSELRAQMRQDANAAADERARMKFDESVRQFDSTYDLNVQKFMLSDRSEKTRAEYMTQQNELSRRRVATLEQRVTLAQRRYDDSKDPGSKEELDKANVALRNAKLRAELTGLTGSDDLDVVSKAANQVMNTPGVVWDRKALNDRIKSDPELGKKINAVIMAGGDIAAARSTDTLSNLLQIRTTGSPSEQAAADNLSKSIVKTTQAEVSNIAGARAAALPEKQLAEVNKAAALRARSIIASAPTPDINFSDNPINVKPLGDYVQIAGMKGGLAKTVTDAGIDLGKIAGDAQLLTTLLYKQRTGAISVTPTELKNQLLSYYQELALLRSGKGDKSSIVYRANLPVPEDHYVINTSSDAKYDLATSSGLLAYIQQIIRKSRLPDFTSEQVTPRDLLTSLFTTDTEQARAAAQRAAFQGLQK